MQCKMLQFKIRTIVNNSTFCAAPWIQSMDFIYIIVAFSVLGHQMMVYKMRLMCYMCLKNESYMCGAMKFLDRFDIYFTCGLYSLWHSIKIESAYDVLFKRTHPNGFFFAFTYLFTCYDSVLYYTHIVEIFYMHAVKVVWDETHKIEPIFKAICK